VYNQKNIGIFRLKETYNFGLGKSSGKYIAILEGDDLWEPEKLERQVLPLENNENIVVAWGKIQSVKDDLSEIYAEHPSCNPAEKKFYFNKPIGCILNLLYRMKGISALTLLIRKECLDKIGGFIQLFNLPLVDFPTLLELSIMGEFYFDESILGQWRIYSGQITKTYPVEIQIGCYALIKQHLSKLPDEIKKNVQIKENEIDDYFNKNIQIGYARSGRYKLMQKKFSEARKDYSKAIFYKGTENYLWRLRSIIGYFFSFLNMDIEWLAKLFGKKTYTS
jgi:glycosyltransferase involved in cell wall biosynthesis